MQELINKRSKHSKSYALGNGQVRMESFMHPIHYKNGNNYDDIDTNMEFEEGFGHKIKKADYNLRFNKKSLRFGFSKNVYIEYSLPKENRVVNGDTCTYLDAWLQTDLEYIIKNEGIKNNIILKDNTAPTIFNFPIDTKGCTLELANNSISIVADGIIIGNIPAPYALDANGDRGNVLINYANSIITFTTDTNWLSTAVYPITIDPSTYQVGANEDDGNSYDTNQFTVSGNTATIGNTYTGFDLFVRFTNVTVANAATITAANISYLSAETKTGSAPITKLHFNVSTNATAPTDRTTFDAKTLSTAYTNWTMPNVTNNSWYDSPDISSVIQEIVNQGGWTSGNAMMLIHKNNASTSGYNRLVRTYEYGSTSGAKLVVTYSAGTAYTLAITSTNTTSSTLLKSVGKLIKPISTLQNVCSKAVNKSVSVINTVSSIVRKMSDKPIGVINTSVCNLVKQGNKIINGVITSLSSSTRVVGKIISTTLSAQDTIAKAITKSIITISTLAYTVVKLIPKTINVISTLVNNTLKQSNKNIISTISQGSSISKLANKILISTIVFSDILTKNIGKLITVVNTVAQNVLKSTTKSIITTCNFIGILSTQLLQGLQTFYVDIITLTTTSLTLSKNIGKNILTIVNNISTIIKTIQKYMLMTNTLSSSITKVITKTIITNYNLIVSNIKTSLFYITTTITNVTTLRKVINKNIVTNMSRLLYLPKYMTKSISTISSTVSTIRKNINKNISTIANNIITITTLKLLDVKNYFVDIMTNYTHGNILQKSTLKQMLPTISTISSLSKGISKFISIISIITPSIIKMSYKTIISNVSSISIIIAEILSGLIVHYITIMASMNNSGYISKNINKILTVNITIINTLVKMINKTITTTYMHLYNLIANNPALVRIFYVNIVANYTIIGNLRKWILGIIGDVLYKFISRSKRLYSFISRNKSQYIFSSRSNKLYNFYANNKSMNRGNNMSIQTFTKQSSESFPISISFIDLLVTSETISSADVVGYNQSNVVVTSDIILTQSIESPLVKVVVKGGVHRLSYKITVKITTSNGNIYEEDIMMKVNDG